MFCTRETVHAWEGGIKYLEIIVFGFINMSKERKKKVMIEKISFPGHFVVLEKHQRWLKLKIVGFQTQTNSLVEF